MLASGGAGGGGDLRIPLTPFNPFRSASDLSANSLMVSCTAEDAADNAGQGICAVAPMA